MNSILASLPEEASIVDLVLLIDYVHDQLYAYGIREERKADDALDALYRRRQELSSEEWEELQTAAFRAYNNSESCTDIRGRMKTARNILAHWRYDPDGHTKYQELRHGLFYSLPGGQPKPAL